MPIDYSKYPPNWKQIRARILKRDENKCRFCGLRNHANGYRNGTGKFVELPEGHYGDVDAEEGESNGWKSIKIVLTIAHLDHDAENWEVEDIRLASLCQKCHNTYDAPFRKANRKKNAAKNSGQIELF